MWWQFGDLVARSVAGQHFWQQGRRLAPSSVSSKLVRLDMCHQRRSFAPERARAGKMNAATALTTSW